MFVLKSLGRLVLGNSQQKDLLALEGGRLSVHNRDNKDTPDVLFKSATLILRRGDTPFSYYLLCRDDDKVESDEVFPITEPKRLLFRKIMANSNKPVGFEWVAGELTFVFEMGSEQVSATTMEMFQITMAQCQFEVEHQKSHSTASDAQLKKFLLETSQKGTKQTPSTDDEIIYQAESPAGWYEFDPNTGLFQCKAEQCKVAIVSEAKSARKNQSFLAIYSLDSDPQTLHRQLIDPDATHHTDRSSSSFVWCWLSDSAYIYTYSLRFPSPAAVMAFSNAIGHAIYKCLNEAEMDAADQKYLLAPFAINDTEMRDAPPLEYDSESESEASGEEQNYEPLKATHSERITGLAVGYKHDRSFVAQGSTLGVFKHTEDDRLEPYTTVKSGFSTLKNASFTPSQMLLHQEDNNLILLDQGNPESIFKMDLTVGKVVEEWKVKDEVSINRLVQSSKYSQMTSEPTLIGINDNSLFRLDPRLSGQNKRVDSETKSYQVKNRFSCGATTGQGELALASAKGDIRLFNKLDKRAKTLLPGFGDAIIGIDVTETGRWIVATCKSYLLLINTEIEPNGQVFGFTKSIPADSKPTPIRLSLKPEHIAYMNQPVSFTPARFSTGSSEERSIITSTGPFVISWNFRRVKQGKLFDYQIKRYDETIVADDFRFGQDRAMIVALPHHVTMMTKKSLASPTAKSLKGSNVKVLEEYDD